MAESSLRAALEASHALGEELDRPGFPASEFAALQAFQITRLEDTYADFSRAERYRNAVAFFLEDLYGGHGFRERDRQVQQILPIMERMLTASLLETMAEAFQLQAVSLELDMVLARRMRERGLSSLDPARYADIYPAVPRARREDQIELICRLGLDLGKLVRRRSLMLLLRAMRAPAHAAGFQALQRFLEDGFQAFRIMGDSRPFVDAVRARETTIMEKLYAGDPEPFRIQIVQPK